MKYTNLAIISAIIAGASNTEGQLVGHLVGDGECVDANNEVYSQYRVTSPALAIGSCFGYCLVELQPATQFFGIGKSPNDCYCYYSGGALPGLSLPNDSRIFTYQHSGNGPIASTKNRTGWQCFAYNAKTASPTAPGETHAPITASPTGSATPAPTPVGMLNYTLIGDGSCKGANDLDLDFIFELFYPPDPTTCDAFCSQIPSSHLLGFAVEPDPSVPGCLCYYSDGNVPNLPIGKAVNNVNQLLSGTGPISKADGTGGGRQCFAYNQGTAPPTVSPTASPSISPSVSPTVSPPSTSPSHSPTVNPSISPSLSPSSSPSKSPTSSPSSSPSVSPSKAPSASPTSSPSTSPSESPTLSPSTSPSISPSNSPSTTPSSSPSTSPTVNPSSVSPTSSPVDFCFGIERFSPCSGPGDPKCLCIGGVCEANSTSPTEFNCNEIEDNVNPPTVHPTSASKSGKVSKSAAKAVKRA